MAEGETVKPETQEEKDCFQVIRDLDYVGGNVSGSTTSKKYMRNEIWSLISSQGAPSWYITLSPADINHPICLYFADTDEKFSPTIKAHDDRKKLIGKNPVAGARFFHFMIELFIKHVLGVDTDHPGVYGNTSAYYGTVEQQGRLTLHLHILLWIWGCLSPQEIRRHIMDPTLDFQRRLVEYLESTHVGEFLTGRQEEVLSNVAKASEANDYSDPTLTLPDKPPKCCKLNCGECGKCKTLISWWSKFETVFDDILSKSDIHRCSTNRNKDGTKNKNRAYTGCIDNKHGNCKARFPRNLYEQTEVDPGTGALNIKKREAMINTVTPILTYLFRSNTDVTSLKSGTGLKAVILYVTDYITKMSLKTHVIFDTVHALFQMNSEMIGGSDSRKEKARRLMTKIVNSLSAKLEIGSPMACMYLLGNPDHYTNMRFALFFWQGYLQKVRKAWSNESNDTEERPEKVKLLKRNGCIVGLSPVHDYIYRPIELSNLNLYDWVGRCKREKLPKDTGDTCESNNGGDGLPDENTAKNENPDPDASQISNTSWLEKDTDSIHELDGKFETITLEDDRNVETPEKGLFTFLDFHPLHKTHGTRCVAEEKALIPNFVGATLPRCDQGDREYYSSAMMTLFKPWRSGLDLKSVEQSWDDVFLSHAFTDRQNELMANLNIKYECLDARDDFHAQFRQKSAVLPSWIDGDQLQQWTKDADDDDCGVPSQYEDNFDPELGIVGKKENKRRQDMSVMRGIMTETGWTEADLDTSLAAGLSTLIMPDKIQSGSKWKLDVQKKRQELLDLRAEHVPSTGMISTTVNAHGKPNQVKIVDKSYLERTSTHHSIDNQLLINNVVQDYELNCEQERAFRIVTNHASVPSEQLKMYIGGMGGTGKSQVLKALVHFFKSLNQSYRFVIVAPTGSAAALLAGSTYHSFFAFDERSDDMTSNVRLAQVKTRLHGVDYMFFDEVSMLSCRDLYRICARLAKVLNEMEVPFGGLNMIFAGDFGQLPPVIGQEHASLYSHTVGSTGSHADQEAAIGKALWHQITTVVILQQNMRQQVQSHRDMQLRQALGNMCYKYCMPEDLVFLRSLVSSHAPGRASVKQKEFQDISIITALNVHKDEINCLGSFNFFEVCER